VRIVNETVDGTRYWKVEADSLYDLTSWLSATPRQRYDIDGSSTKTSASQSWDLGAGYEGALALARNGWEEGRDKLYHANAKLSNDSQRPELHYDVAGERPDVARYVAGDPRHMISHKRRDGHKPIITLVVNVTAAGMASADSMVNYGAALLSVIDTLENSGRRVEVIGGYITTSIGGAGKEVASITWMVKRAEDPVDLAALAFSLAHPAMSRRLGFAAMERMPWRLKGGSGYGNATHIPTAKDLIDPSNNVLVLKGAGEYTAGHAVNCATVQGAYKLAVKQINEAAGETVIEEED